MEQMIKTFYKINEFSYEIEHALNNWIPTYVNNILYKYSI